MTLFRADHPYQALDGHASPYGYWSIGNIHVHDNPFNAALGQLYWARDTRRYIAVTQHSRPEHGDGKYSDPQTIRDLALPNFFALSGLEVEILNEIHDPNNSPGHHFLHVKPQMPDVLGERAFVTTTTTQPTMIEVAKEGQYDNSIVVAAHPSMGGVVFDDALLVELASHGLTGLEVWNHSGDANVRGQTLVRDSSSKWDFVLSAGKRIWGFADDDFFFGDGNTAFKKAGNVAWTIGFADHWSIFRALKSGCFFATTGLLFEHITLDTGRSKIELTVALNDASLKCFSVIDGGVKTQITSSSISGNFTTFAFELDQNSEATYVRFIAEAVIQNNSVSAWTQPFLTDLWTARANIAP